MPRDTLYYEYAGTDMFGLGELDENVRIPMRCMVKVCGIRCKSYTAISFITYEKMIEKKMYMVCTDHTTTAQFNGYKC